jgi:hypothetical protein
MADELEASIIDNVQGPAKVAGVAGSVEQHALSEQIARVRYFVAKSDFRQRDRRKQR